MPVVLVEEQTFDLHICTTSLDIHVQLDIHNTRMFNIVGEREQPNLSAGCVKSPANASDHVKEMLCHFHLSASPDRYINLFYYAHTSTGTVQLYTLEL